jgi:predicted PurR-regulated permease PerM
MSTGADRSQPRRTEVVVSGATVLKAALIALTVYAVIVAHEVILTIALSFVFALGLDPLVTRLTRRGIGRGRAALVVFFLLFVIVAVLVIWAVTPIWNEARELVNEFPGYVEDLKDEPVTQQVHDTPMWRTRPSSWRGRPLRRSRRRPARCSGSRARSWGPCSAWSRSSS